MERKTRKPTQKRALEKIEKIVDAGYKLFNEKGYYNTTTADIAKEAGVATGSVYAYFEDKKDIYLQVIRRVFDSFFPPTEDFWIQNNNFNPEDHEAIKALFGSFIKLMMNYHNFSKTYHDELEALSLLDEDIGNLVNELEASRVKKVEEISKLVSTSFKSEEDLKIFAHYSILLVDDVCHKILYDDTVKDTNLYIDKCGEMLYTLFKSTTAY
ncbi:MAG: TetR/AcrR family transcriptional regulator [Bacillota bacterium]|nr:TetR/AcrR family transcriptional regulator [Bacillota bacterium]